MVARIAIRDPLPAFCRGVMAILRDTGFEAEVPNDILAWLHDDQTKLLFLSLLTPQDWILLEELKHRDPHAAVVAFLDDMSMPSHVRALTAGAIAALPRDASPSSIREAFTAVLNGHAVIPIAVLRELLQRPAETDARRLSQRERDWLHDLANGMTINHLAAKAGYSERMMFRMLRDLYTRLGAKTKVEALMRARENGWL